MAAISANLKNRQRQESKDGVAFCPGCFAGEQSSLALSGLLFLPDIKFRVKRVEVLGIQMLFDDIEPFAEMSDLRKVGSSCHL